MTKKTSTKVKNASKDVSVTRKLDADYVSVGREAIRFADLAHNNTSNARVLAVKALIMAHNSELQLSDNVTIDSYIEIGKEQRKRLTAYYDTILLNVFGFADRKDYAERHKQLLREVLFLTIALIKSGADSYRFEGKAKLFVPVHFVNPKSDDDTGKLVEVVNVTESNKVARELLGIDKREPRTPSKSEAKAETKSAAKAETSEGEGEQVQHDSTGTILRAAAAIINNRDYAELSVNDRKAWLELLQACACVTDEEHYHMFRDENMHINDKAQLRKAA